MAMPLGNLRRRSSKCQHMSGLRFLDHFCHPMGSHKCWWGSSHVRFSVYWKQTCRCFVGARTSTCPTKNKHVASSLLPAAHHTHIQTKATTSPPLSSLSSLNWTNEEFFGTSLMVPSRFLTTDMSQTCSRTFAMSILRGALDALTLSLNRARALAIPRTISGDAPTHAANRHALRHHIH